ncbi:hypothetical protein AAMO2058_001498700 [Amorphochlora amoebiformis]|mmetsp:Transcript_11656/g.18472  ORF Transcript_11656/g.18472 Transcript_11656/m.18472 type:complete len:294 (-) Transcript_11656:249-1130(-)
MIVYLAPLVVLGSASAPLTRCRNSRVPGLAGFKRQIPEIWRQGSLRGVRMARGAKEGEEDFITSVFTGLFGKKARDDPEPLGLRRATVEEFPDLWPPTQELGEPLQGDSPDIAQFRPYLKQTKLETAPLLLAFDAEKDGWSNSAFRKAMDGSYAAVLIGQTAEGTVFGAYNPAGWLGYGDYRECISAFLFTWPDGDVSKEASKLPKVGGPSMAILDERGKGPQWGPDGLKINLDSRSGVSRLGSYYQRMPNGANTIFSSSEGNYADLISLKIYVAEELSEAAKNYEPKFTQWS